MPDFAYLNARIRAMRSRLLPPAALAQMAALPDLHRFLLALAPTCYGPALSLCRGDDHDCLVQALRQDALATLAHLRRLCSGQERGFAEAVFAGFDAANVVAVLGGVAAAAPVEQTLQAVLPFGRLSAARLAAAAAAPGIGAAVALLSGDGAAVVAPLLALLQRVPDAGTWEIEAALERWRFGLVMACVQEGDVHETLREALRLDVDVANLLLALRLAAAPREREALAARLGVPGLASLFAAHGRVEPANLARAAVEASPAAAIAALSGGAYGDVFLSATDATGAERALRSHRRRRLVALATADPLGPGLLVGYLAAKRWELSRLGRIGSRLAGGKSATDLPELAA